MGYKTSDFDTLEVIRCYQVWKRASSLLRLTGFWLRYKLHNLACMLYKRQIGESLPDSSTGECVTSIIQEVISIFMSSVFPHNSSFLSSVGEVHTFRIHYWSFSLPSSPYNGISKCYAHLVFSNTDILFKPLTVLKILILILQS